MRKATVRLQFCLQVFLFAGFRWSANFHRVARLSKNGTVKAGHPQSPHYQEMVWGLRLACMSELSLAARIALGFAHISLTFQILSSVFLAFAFHDSETELHQATSIIHF